MTRGIVYLLLFVVCMGVAFAGEKARDGRFIAYDDGTVIDTQTNLMWADEDNGSNINWDNANKYCKNYTVGGYTDWRLPTKNELKGLFDKDKSKAAMCDEKIMVHFATELIDLTCCALWAFDTSVYFDIGRPHGRLPKGGGFNHRVVPVRTIK